MIVLDGSQLTEEERAAAQKRAAEGETGEDYLTRTFQAALDSYVGADREEQIQEMRTLGEKMVLLSPEARQKLVGLLQEELEREGKAGG